MLYPAPRLFFVGLSVKSYENWGVSFSGVIAEWFNNRFKLDFP